MMISGAYFIYGGMYNRFSLGYTPNVIQLFYVAPFEIIIASLFLYQ